MWVLIQSFKFWEFIGIIVCKNWKIDQQELIMIQNKFLTKMNKKTFQINV